MPYIIDPLGIGTDGVVHSYDYTDPYAISINGFLIFLTEEIIETPNIISVAGGVGGPSHKKRRKRITATIRYNDVDYIETVETENLSIKLSDVNVTVLMEDRRPKLTIILE